jgi:hypothetical protein
MESLSVSQAQHMPQRAFDSYNKNSRILSDKKTKFMKNLVYLQQPCLLSVFLILVQVQVSISVIGVLLVRLGLCPHRLG